MFILRLFLTNSKFFFGNIITFIASKLFHMIPNAISTAPILSSILRSSIAPIST